MTDDRQPVDQDAPSPSAPEPAPWDTAVIPPPAAGSPGQAGDAGWQASPPPSAGWQAGPPPTQAGWGAPPAAPVAPTKFCQACGQSIDARAEICPKCGVRQPWIPGMAGGGLSIGTGDGMTRTGKSKTVAALIAIFLGGLGIHKFYLGDTVQGVIYLVFFWTAIPAIVGLIEGILWLIQSNEQWLAKYGDR